MQLTQSNKQGLIIGLCGRLCSGKKEIAMNILEKSKLNCQAIEINETFHINQFLNELIQEMHTLQIQPSKLTFTDEEINILEKQIRKMHIKHLHPNDSQQKLVQALNFSMSHQILFPLTVDNEFELLNHRNYFHLIAVNTPTKIRYANFVKKYPYEISLQLFCIIDEIISEKVQEYMQKAKVTILNMGDQKDLTIQLFQQFQDIFRPVKPNWHQYFMHLAHIVKKRSNCMKRAVGVLIVKNDRIVAAGYNGTPFGLKNCWENGCDRCNSNTKQGVDLEKCFCFHAEESALLEVGTSKSKNMVMYTTLFPCLQCTKIILATKITQIYYEEDFANSAATSELHKYVKVQQVDTSHYVY